MTTDEHDAACLDYEALEAWASGSPSDPRVERHLRDCRICRQLVESIQENNQLMKLVGETIRPRPEARQPVESARQPAIPGYEILAEVSRGGQGVVFKAVQQATRRIVAVKVLLDDQFGGAARRRRFEREVEVVAGLRHSSIVTVHDSGTTADGRLYLVMEYIEGRSLAQSLSEARAGRGGIGPVEHALDLFGRICGALAHAHQHGVIHRDLKPSNILIDNEGHPHIVDFGLAKLAVGDASHSFVTAGGEFVGTIVYAAPEQVRGDPSGVDVRTDVYALGLILYEILTGRLPYAVGVGLSETVQAITSRIPARPSSVGSYRASSAILKDVDAITLKCLAKDPRERYQSAGELAADIRRAMAGQPIEARRDSAVYVLTRTLRRHWAPASAAAGLFVVALVVAAAMSMLYRRSATEAAKANQIRIFLEDTLGSVEPPRPGQDVTVRDVLHEAVHWVQISLKDQPEVEAALRETIGNSYRALGDYATAEEHLTHALAIHRRLFGESHRAVARTVSLLGHVHRDRGDLAGAESHFRQALDMRRALLGPAHPDVSSSLQNLASVLAAEGDGAGAERLLRESLSIRISLYGEQHQDVAMACYKLAELLRSTKDPAEAERLHREALDTRRALLDADHPDVRASLLALGELLLDRERYVEAEPLCREAAAGLERIEGDQHVLTARARLNLGRALAGLHRFPEAESELIEAQRVFSTADGVTPAQLMACIEALVWLNETWDKAEPDKGRARTAAEWRDRLEAVRARSREGGIPDQTDPPARTPPNRTPAKSGKWRMTARSPARPAACLALLDSPFSIPPQPQAAGDRTRRECLSCSQPRRREHRQVGAEAGCSYSYQACAGSIRRAISRMPARIKATPAICAASSRSARLGCNLAPITINA